MIRRIVLLAVVVILVSQPVTAMGQSRSRGKTATFLEMFPREQMDCGKRGWTFDGLIGGRMPLTACILKYRNNAGRSPFGQL